MLFLYQLICHITLSDPNSTDIGTRVCNWLLLMDIVIAGLSWLLVK